MLVVLPPSLPPSLRLSIPGTYAHLSSTAGTLEDAYSFAPHPRATLHALQRNKRITKGTDDCVGVGGGIPAGFKSPFLSTIINSFAVLRSSSAVFAALAIRRSSANFEETWPMVGAKVHACLISASASSSTYRRKNEM
jgi:hypothetical protein